MKKRRNVMVIEAKPSVNNYKIMLLNMLFRHFTLLFCSHSFSLLINMKCFIFLFLLHSLFSLFGYVYNLLISIFFISLFGVKRKNYAIYLAMPNNNNLLVISFYFFKSVSTTTKKWMARKKNGVCTVFRSLSSGSVAFERCALFLKTKRSASLWSSLHDVKIDLF